MSEHLLKHIDITDFKCFTNFHAEGFKRVNLIGGKNNVGKTAFMEACYINTQAQNLACFVGALNSIKYMRENLNILDGATYSIKLFIEYSNNLIFKSNINSTSFKIKDDAGIKKYIFEFNNESVEVNINHFSYEINYINNISFIDNFGLFNSEIINNYSAIQKKDKEYYLNEIVNKFDERIKAFKVIDDKPQCKINENYFEITEFGDGVRHLISIVTALYSCENGYLFIDEIDNGIHYTQIDTIWEIILKVSKELNVQVFCTTHSKECIDSYARVSKKLDDQDVCFIKMSRLKDNSIKAGVRDYEMIQDSVEDEHELRGW
ncbi:MAG: AAA family ATPase [Helicobacteraceae bacterium]|nr:AAA family ATPase [Helicobacteraceae bacterium]